MHSGLRLPGLLVAVACVLSGLGCGGKVVVDAPTGDGDGGAGGSGPQTNAVALPYGALASNPKYGQWYPEGGAPAGALVLLTSNAPVTCDALIPEGYELGCDTWQWTLGVIVPPALQQVGSFSLKGPLADADPRSVFQACNGAFELGGNGQVTIESLGDTTIVAEVSVMPTVSMLDPSGTLVARRCED